MTRELYELGQLPPLGTVPEKMHAALVRRERFGEPSKAIQNEVIDVPEVGPGQILMLVMAAGVNYNNVWASLGRPLDVIGLRQKRGEKEDFHIGGSEGSGIVWAVGEGVKEFKVGDHIIVSPGQWDESAADIRMGADPMTSTTLLAYGYESNWGTFAQFARVMDLQCHPKPAHLTWEQAACFPLTGSTAYRQLCGWPPNVVQPGDPVLVWGGAGGVGSMAIQIVKALGGIPVAVVSSDDRAEYCRQIGAKGVIDRREFGHWGRLPDLDDLNAVGEWMRGARAFGKRLWEELGERRSPKIVLEHPGQDTIPTSMYVCDNAGMVVICGGTSGYNADVDLRFLWMRQKRLQGSHGANLREVRAVIHMVASGQVDPCLSETLPFDDVATAHQRMYENQHPPGNQAILVNALHPGQTDVPGGVTG